ncbi:MAG: NUDIX hydrolase [Chloroflexi bacterium]|nr:NUDIX hydrolase [Chloroflexota bacterium]
MNTDPRRNPRRHQPATQPIITTAAGRELACYPAFVHAFIVDTWEDRFLLMRRPGQAGWETVGGVLEAGETVPEAAVRELKAAAGAQFLAAYLGVLDTFTFIFDANLPPSISICCLLRHQGGEIRPGRNVQGAEFRWWWLSELDNIDMAGPRGRWDLLTRSVEMSRHLRDARRPEVQARDDDEDDHR